MDFVNFRHKKFPEVIQPVLESIESITKKCEEILESLNKCKDDSAEVSITLQCIMNGLLKSYLICGIPWT